MLTMWWGLLYTLLYARPCKAAGHVAEVVTAAKLHLEASVRPPDTAGFHSQELGVCQAWGLPAGAVPTNQGHLGCVECRWLRTLGSQQRAMTVFWASVRWVTSSHCRLLVLMWECLRQLAALLLSKWRPVSGQASHSHVRPACPHSLLSLLPAKRPSRPHLSSGRPISNTGILMLNCMPASCFPTS